MAGRIPDETLQAIRERTSIVEIVSGYVSLKKAGRNHLGLCPFHAEKTPSFTVNDERGLFHCFGCGAGGTVFTFVMRAERIGFPEAIEMLARRAGVPLPKRTEAGPGGEQRQELLQLNDLAQRCFIEAFGSPAGVPARQYLEKRGVSVATVERYGLGFCPPTGAGLIRTLAPKPVATQKAVELGLLGRRTNGTLYERFWGRVTFPIRDGSGRIVGFGGRTLGSEHPKYLNSPESTLFHKGQVLYGLYEARKAAQDAERIIVVEGYLDALALVEAGIEHTVASLGTALGAAQLRLARRFAPEIVAFFDGDRAGQEAAVRAFSVCVETGIWGLGAFLPDGFDPDTFVRTRGADATRALLEQAVPLADFFIERIDPGPAASVPQRVRAAERIAAVINNLRDPVQYGMLAKQAAQRVGVDETVFRELRASQGGASRAGTIAATSGAPSESYRQEEVTLIEAMALDRDVAALVAHRGVLECFASEELAAAGRTLVNAWEQEHSTASAVDELPPLVAQRVTAGLLGDGAMAHADRSQAAHDCIEKIRRRASRLQTRELRSQLQRAEASGDDASIREHLQRYNEDLLRRKEIGHG